MYLLAITWLNISQRVGPSTEPLLTERPISFRFETFITTNTQCVFSVMDSQQNKLILYELSFIFAIKDNQEGPPLSSGHG